MERERACSRCLYWDLGRVEQRELDEDGIPIAEYFARCLNPDSPYDDRYTETQDVRGAFVRRGLAVP